MPRHSKRRACWPSWSSPAHEDPDAVADSRVPVPVAADARQQLPVLPELLRLRDARRSSDTACCAAPGSPRGASAAVTRITPGASTPFLEPIARRLWRRAYLAHDGYPAPHPFRDLLLVRVLPVVGVAAGARAAAAAGRAAGAGQRRTERRASAERACRGALGRARPGAPPAGQPAGGAGRNAGRVGEPEGHDQDRPVHGRGRHGRRRDLAGVARQAPGRDRSREAVPRAAAQRRAHVRRAGGAHRRGPAQRTRRSTKSFPARRELAPGSERSSCGSRPLRPTATRSPRC